MTRARTLAVCALLAMTALVWWRWPSTRAALGSDAPIPGRAELVPEVCPPLPAPASGRVAYPSLLRMMGEPSLGCGPMVEDEVYRVVAREGAAAAPPLSIRVSRSEGVRMLIARQYAWTQDADPERPLGVIVSRVRTLTEDEWRDLESALASADFWDMPREPDDAASEAGRWQIEGRRGRGYHHVERMETGAGAFGELARYLLRVGGFAGQAQ